MATDPEEWPEYCCAILRDRCGRYLLERRGPDVRWPQGRWTCFGGRREPGEHPDRCLEREMREELGVVLEAPRLAVTLLGTGSRVIAWFYTAAAPPPDVLKTEPGVEAVWLPPDRVNGVPLSDWHITALAAEREGHSVALVVEHR